MSRRSVAKWPDIGAARRTRGCSPAPSFLNRRRVANGVCAVTSSTTRCSTPSTVTRSIPHAGRACVISPSASVCHAAASRRADPCPADRRRVEQRGDAGSAEGAPGPGGVGLGQEGVVHHDDDGQCGFTTTPSATCTPAPGKLASRRLAGARRRSLACALRRLPHPCHRCRHSPLRSRAKKPAAAVRGRRAAAAGANDADAVEQELFVLVAARLADGALRRPRLRRGDGLA